MDGLLIEDFAALVEAHGGHAAFEKKTLVDVYYALIKPAVLESGKSYRSLLRAKRPIGISASECLVVVYHWEMMFEDFLDALESCSRSYTYWMDFMCIDCAITLGSVREQPHSHQHWAASTRAAVRNASGCAILLEQWSQARTLHTIPALYILDAVVSANRPIHIGMAPNARRMLDKVMSGDSPLAAVQCAALSPALRDYDSRALPGGELLRDDLVRVGWEEAHRSASEALHAALLCQSMPSTYKELGPAVASRLARHLRSQLDVALSMATKNLLSADFEPLSRALVDQSTQLHGEGHVDTLLSLFIRGAALARCGQWSRAAACVRQCFQGRRDLLGTRHADTLTAMSLLGECCRRAGDPEAAEPVLKECLQAQRETLGADHADTLQSLFRWGQLLYDRGQYSCAAGALEDCLRRQQRALGTGHPSALATLLRLAFAHNIQQHFEQAEGAFAAYVSLVREAPERGSVEVERGYQCALEHLAHLYFTQTRFALAKPLYEEQWQLAIAQHGAAHPVALEHQNCLANVCVRLAQLDQARQLYLDCSQKAASHFGADHSVTRLYLENYRTSLRAVAKSSPSTASDSQAWQRVDCRSVVDETMLEEIGVDVCKLNSEAVIGSTTCAMQ